MFGYASWKVLIGVLGKCTALPPGSLDQLPAVLLEAAAARAANAAARAAA